MLLEPRGNDRRRFEARRQYVDHRPQLAFAVHGGAIPFAAERNISRLAPGALLEEDIAGDRAVTVAAQKARTGGERLADLHHFDLAVVERMGTEETSVRKTEADP